MLIKFKDYDSIIDVMPCIDRYDRYMIMIGFNNGESLAYSFNDRESFLLSYRQLIKKVGSNVGFC